MTFMPHRLTCKLFAPSRRRGLFFLLAALYSLFVISPAHAACSSPAGAAGKIIYNADQKVVQYCDDTNWIPAGLPGSGSGGCTSPARAEGTIIYNADNAVMQFCGGAVWVPMAQPGTASTAGSLVGHWKLDESSGTSAADSSGNGNTGTLTNFPGSPPWSTTGGMINGTLTFDGVNDGIMIADSSTVNFDPGQSITVAAWVNTSSYANSPTILNKFSGMGANYNFAIDSSGSVAFLFYDSGGTGHGYATTFPVVTANVWVHIAFTYTAGSPFTAKMYINGVNQAGSWYTGTGAAQPFSDANGLSIGTYSNGTVPISNFLNGRIDDVRIYKRILSASEIAALAEDGADTTTNLLGHWKLDESSGTTAADSSGNGWTATQYNSGPTWAPAGGSIDGAALFSPIDANNDITKPHLTLGTGFDIPAMPFTIAVWVNPTDYNDYRGIIGKRTWFSPEETRFFLQLSNFTGTVILQGGSTLSQAGFAYSPPTGQWTHLAVVASATSSDLYVNGVLQESAPAIALGTLASGAYANIGDNGEVESLGGSMGDGDPWKGYLDDVRVYSRALNAVDIAVLANSFPGDCYSPKGYKGELIYNSTKTMLFSTI